MDNTDGYFAFFQQINQKDTTFPQISSIRGLNIFQTPRVFLEPEPPLTTKALILGYTVNCLCSSPVVNLKNSLGEVPLGGRNSWETLGGHRVHSSSSAHAETQHGASSRMKVSLTHILVLQLPPWEIWLVTWSVFAAGVYTPGVEIKILTYLYFISHGWSPKKNQKPKNKLQLVFSESQCEGLLQTMRSCFIHKSCAWPRLHCVLLLFLFGLITCLWYYIYCNL